MTRLMPAAGLAAAIMLSSAGLAVAADDQAGTPLAPGDAAGPWTLESAGRTLCVLKLGKESAGTSTFKLEAPASCAGALPASVAGWAPSPGGMNLVDADGRSLIGFSRWSNSLLVSHRSSGVDIQLLRGGPNP